MSYDHLLGNERPCDRCVKRNIGDSCADGVRKKAKYLHDEDMVPTRTMLEKHLEESIPQHLAQRQLMNQQQSQQPQAHPYNLDQSIGGTMGDSHASSAIQMNPQQQRQDLYTDDPANGWFAGLNTGFGLDKFNSSYVGTELNALRQVAVQNIPQLPGSGNGGTPDNVSIGSQTGLGYATQQYIPFSNTGNDLILDSWATSRSNSAGANMGNIPHTFTIATGPGSITTPSPPAGSPQASHSQQPGIYDTMSGSPRNAAGAAFFRQPHQHASQMDQQSRQTAHYTQPHHHQLHTHQGHLQASYQAGHQPIRRRPPFDPTHVYTTVTEPYSYVQAYHRLFAAIDLPRFTKEKQLRIARAFATFRPSFIASTEALRRADLVFQEKCCQRAIHIYEASLPNIGTPTLICRRSGEIVVVGKEFSMLSGWPKEVLLGEKPNLNTNIPCAKEGEEAARMAQRNRQRLLNRFSTFNGGRDSSEDSKDGGDEDSGADRNPRMKPTSSGPKPVFLLELLDDDSVCEFYEDFSKLAFADSTGKITRKCKILKYKPPPPPSPPGDIKDHDSDREDSKDGGRVNGTDAKANGKRTNTSAIDVLGSSTTIECMMCWTLRRDVFDIPMLIILNVSCDPSPPSSPS